MREIDFLLYFRFPTDDLQHCHVTNVAAISSDEAVNRFLKFYPFVEILHCHPGLVMLYGKPWALIDLFDGCKYF